MHAENPAWSSDAVLSLVQFPAFLPFPSDWFDSSSFEAEYTSVLKEYRVLTLFCSLWTKIPCIKVCRKMDNFCRIARQWKARRGIYQQHRAYWDTYWLQHWLWWVQMSRLQSTLAWWIAQKDCSLSGRATAAPPTSSWDSCHSLLRVDSTHEIAPVQHKDLSSAVPR